MTADAIEQAAAVSALAKYGSDLAFWAELPDPNGVPEGWAATYRENLERLLRVALNRFEGERERLQLLRSFREDCRKLISLVDCQGQAWAVMDSSRAVSVGVQSLRDVLAQADLAAGVAAVKTAAAAPEPAAPAALGDDQSQVNAKQLAAHAGCTDRQIREVLRDCPAETVRSGAKIWRYGDVLAKLRQWCEDNRQERLQAVEWPDLAKNLKNKAAGTKKK